MQADQGSVGLPGPAAGSKIDRGARPRVAQFVSGFVPFSQTFIYQEVLHHSRYEVEVFARTRLNADEFPYDRVASLEPSGSLRGWLAARAYEYTALSPTFLREIRGGRFSLVHAQFGPAGVYALPYAAAARLPLVVTFCGYEVPVLLTSDRFRPRYWGYWALSGEVMRRAALLLAVSKDLAGKLILAGAPAHKVRVCHRGVHVPERVEPRREPPDAGLSVLMVGRFIEKKGLGHGVEAFARALRAGVDGRLRIVGDGPLRAESEALVRRHGIGDRVTFLGQLPYADTLEEMGRADLLLVPSVTARNGDTEGTPNVLKEANARAVPAIVTRHGGAPEVVEEGRTGLVVEERDDDAMAGRIVRLARDPALRRRMGDAAREKMKRELDFSVRIEALERLYDEAVGGAGRR